MPKTVLITGTSSGYGKAMADLFLERGWNVLATMRRPDEDVFPLHSERLKILALDVTSEASIQNAIHQGFETFGAIDAWINNAGIGLGSIVEATPDGIVREIFETNTFGVIAACRAIIPRMRGQGGGVIVNITSAAAIAPMPLAAIYAASKWAVEGFTEALSFELERFNIKARLVEPGYAPTTRFSENLTPRMEGLLPEAYSEFIKAALGRMGHYPTAFCTEAEVADATYAAVTDASTAVRFPAGPDTKLLADLRWSTSETHYRQRMREMFGPDRD